MAKRRLLKEQRLRREIEGATDRVLEQVRENHHDAYAYLNRKKYSDSLEANAKKKELGEHLTKRARGLFKILTDGEPIIEESKEYAGYSDETSARVASYNYTTVEKVIGFNYKHSSELRKGAKRDLRRLIKESPEIKLALENGDKEVRRYKLWLDGERDKRIDAAKGCLTAIVFIGFTVVEQLLGRII